MKIMELLSKGGLQAGQIIIENTGSVTYNDNRGRSDEEKSSDKMPSSEQLASALAAVQPYMWGASAYAVLFCEFRDHRGYPNNMAQFERMVDALASENRLSWRCKAGTLSDAFNDNTYLKFNVDRWKEINVKERPLLLLKKFQEALP